jgi:hypothetical protein
MAFKSKKYLIPALIFKPSVAAIFAGAYYLTGKFDIYKAYTEYPSAEIAQLKARRNTFSDPRISYFVPDGRGRELESEIKLQRDEELGDPGVWLNLKTMFRPILKDAISRGLFQDEKEVKTFFRDLELASEPAFDDQGRLILNVKYYGLDRRLGITRDNLLAPGSDRELALKLILTKLYFNLKADEKNRGDYKEVFADWMQMRELTHESLRPFEGIVKSRGRFVPQQPVDSTKRKLEKLVIAITH